MVKARKIFKDPVSSKDQLMLLPLSVKDFVPEDSEVRVFNEIIESMDHSQLLAKYNGGGAPAYNPIMLIKVIIYAGCKGIRSSRKIAELLGKDLEYMFLSEMARPNFRTISDFRKANLDTIERIYKETIRISMRMGLVLLEHVSIDGTRMEANVSKENSFTKERVKEAMKRAEERIRRILAEAEEVDREEDAKYGDREGNKIDESLRKAEAGKKKLQEIRATMEEEGLNTVGWTDKDSRVMKTARGKRAGYNMQAAVDSHSQIIVGGDVSQESADNSLMPGMVEEVKENTGVKPAIVTADGGYYSPKALKYVEKEKIDAYIPEQHKAKEEWRKDFEYDETRDVFRCPGGHELTYSTAREHGEYTYRVYKLRCKGCPLVEGCAHTNKSRKIEIWVRMNGELQDKMSAKVRSREGRGIYGKRMAIIEPVIGNIKHNQGLWKLSLRGLTGAKIEFYLGCIGHNIRKICRYWAERKVLQGA